MRDPVAKRGDVALRVDPHLAGLAKLLDGDRRKLREHFIGQRARPPREGRLGRADDHPLLVDPDPGRHVDDPQQLVQQVRGVDQRRVGGLGVVDPWDRGVRAAGVQCDAHHLEPRM